jgi:hypothetical protein
MTTAERIAELFDNDGQRYELADGRELSEICDAEDVCMCEALDDGGTKWTFADASMLVDHGYGWDVGISEHCTCGKGAGHHAACRVGSTVRLALDPRHDLSEAGQCTCDTCCAAFAEDFANAAGDIAEERGFEIDVICCDYGSPEAYRTDQGEDITALWQEAHNRTPWGEAERPVDCETRE